jgi:hypothetical protein
VDIVHGYPLPVQLCFPSGILWPKSVLPAGCTLVSGCAYCWQEAVEAPHQSASLHTYSGGVLVVSWGSLLWIILYMCIFYAICMSVNCLCLLLDSASSDTEITKFLTFKEDSNLSIEEYSTWKYPSLWLFYRTPITPPEHSQLQQPAHTDYTNSSILA